MPPKTMPSTSYSTAQELSDVPNPSPLVRAAAENLLASSKSRLAAFSPSLSSAVRKTTDYFSKTYLGGAAVKACAKSVDSLDSMLQRWSKFVLKGQLIHIAAQQNNRTLDVEDTLLKLKEKERHLLAKYFEVTHDRDFLVEEVFTPHC